MFEFRSPFLGKRSVPDYFNPPSFIGKRLESDIIPMDEDVIMVAPRRANRYSRRIAKYSRFTSSRYPRSPYRASRYSSRRSSRRPVRTGGYRNAVRTEFKYKDMGANQATNTTTSFVLLNGTAEGVGPTQHVGRRVMLRSVQVKFRSYVTDTTGTDQVHRVMLVYDKQTNQVAPGITDILVAAGDNTLRNLDNRSRFTILLDKRIDLNAAGESGSQIVWDYYKKLMLPTQYDATADDTVASITTGSLYLVIFGSNAPGVTAGTTSYNSRVRYTDY